MTDNPIDDADGSQRKRLQMLAQTASGWGVMLFIHRPGDVAFLAPIYPEFRGYEIVSADRAGTYDIWRDGHLTDDHSLTLDAVCEWLRSKTQIRTDEGIKARVVEWTEETLRYYQIAERPA
jgi:hypothetical protein